VVPGAAAEAARGGTSLVAGALARRSAAWDWGLAGEELTDGELTDGELTGGELAGGELTGGELTGGEPPRR
jgi:hypothetical protein